MRKRNFKAIHKKRTVIATTVLCLVAAVGMAGVYRLEKLKSVEEESLVNWEETASQKEEEINTALDNTTSGYTTKTVEEKEQETLADNNGVVAENQEETIQEDMAQAAEALAEPLEETDLALEEAAEAAGSNAVTLNFTKEDRLVWPVRGNVILDYSMDSSIYFPTLNQYKYNPAIIIQSEVGTEVVAAASGKVDSIEESDETGLTLTLDIGNNYKLVYGQLEAVNISTGSYLEEGQIFATVSNPTKYYSVEGSNLYFKVLENDKPIDPLDYLK